MTRPDPTAYPSSWLASRRPKKGRPVRGSLGKGKGRLQSQPSHRVRPACGAHEERPVMLLST